MTGAQLAALLALAAVAALVLYTHRKRSDPQGWQIGPIIRGEQYSVGMPAQPQITPEGVLVEFGQGQELHCLTMPCGPLAGKSRISAVVAVEGTLEPAGFPGSPATMTLHFQRAGDDWSGTGKYEAFRWYAKFAQVIPLAPGEYRIEAPLDGNWSAVQTSTRATNPAGFADAVANAARVGLVFGGGDGVGHGVRATGPARIIVRAIEIT